MMMFKTSLVPFALLLINPTLSYNEELRAYYQEFGTYGNPINAPNTQITDNDLTNNVLQGDGDETLNKDSQIPFVMPNSAQADVPTDSSQDKDVLPKTGNQLDDTKNPEITKTQNNSQYGKTPIVNLGPVTLSEDAVGKAIDDFTNAKSASGTNPITILNTQVVADNVKKVADAAKAEPNNASLQQASQLVANLSKDESDSNKLQQSLQQNIQKDPKNEQAINDMAFTLFNGDVDGLNKLKTAANKKLESDPKASETVVKNLVQFFGESNSMEVFGSMVAGMATEDPALGRQLLANMFSDAFSINSRSDKQLDLITQIQQNTRSDSEMYPGFEQIAPNSAQIPADLSSQSPSTQLDQKPETNPDQNLSNTPEPVSEQSQEKPVIPEVQKIPTIPPPNDSSYKDLKPENNDKLDSQNSVPETNAQLGNGRDNTDKEQPETNTETKPESMPEAPSKDVPPTNDSNNINPSGNNGGLPNLPDNLQQILGGPEPKTPEDFERMFTAFTGANSNTNPSDQKKPKPNFFSDSDHSVGDDLASTQQPATVAKPLGIPAIQQEPTRNPSLQGVFQFQQSPLAWKPQAQRVEIPSFNGQQFPETFNINQFATPSNFQTQPQQQQQQSPTRSGQLIQAQYQNYYNPYFAF